MIIKLTSHHSGFTLLVNMRHVLYAEQSRSSGASVLLDANRKVIIEARETLDEIYDACEEARGQ